MGFFYIDDSKHPAAGFCLSTIVYSGKNPQLDLEALLAKHGLIPGRDEFKSSIRMDRHPAIALLRDDLKAYLHNCRIGVAISRSPDELYGDSAHLFQNMLRDSRPTGRTHQLFADCGIFPTYREQAVLKTIPEAGDFQFHFEQDSKNICGIQLADLAAHTCSIMLKDSLGLVNKMVKAGDNSGYDPDSDMELGFEMWASMRYSFHGAFPSDEEYYDRHLTVENFGLAISPNLDERIRAAAKSRFSKMYLGCIH